MDGITIEMIETRADFYHNLWPIQSLGSDSSLKIIDCKCPAKFWMAEMIFFILPGHFDSFGGKK